MRAIHSLSVLIWLFIVPSCGGPPPPAAHALGAACDGPSDCDSSACGNCTDCSTFFGVESCVGCSCIAPSCFDKWRNGDESGIDCGGPTCAPCTKGQQCERDSDCADGLPCVTEDGWFSTCGCEGPYTISDAGVWQCVPPSQWPCSVYPVEGPSGCRDDTGYCVDGHSPTACGDDGAKCSVCAEDEECVWSGCRPKVSPDAGARDGG